MFVAAFLTFMSIGGFPSFVEDMKGVMILSGGFFRLPHDLPKPFWKFPMYYIAFHKYVYQGFYKNEFLGLTFPNEQIGGPSMISGDEVLRSVWQVEMGGCCNSFWDATSGLIAKTSKSCVYFVVMDQITLQRLQLLKSVLFAIQTFWGSDIHSAKTTVLKAIESICRTFLWTGGSDPSKKAMVALEHLCLWKTAVGLTSYIFTHGIRRQKR
ncbi:hypothetical protein FXO37_27196 [Capsicum annuum]|nr:hypothetical protein FXO37_27196 [Capsicum annuum]